MSVQDVSANGTSIWLDDLSRAKITSAEPHALPARIKHSSVQPLVAQLNMRPISH
jgi:transaldolase